MTPRGVITREVGRPRQSILRERDNFWHFAFPVRKQQACVRKALPRFCAVRARLICQVPLPMLLRFCFLDETAKDLNRVSMIDAVRFYDDLRFAAKNSRLRYITGETTPVHSFTEIASIWLRFQVKSRMNIDRSPFACNYDVRVSVGNRNFEHGGKIIRHGLVRRSPPYRTP